MDTGGETTSSKSQSTAASSTIADQASGSTPADSCLSNARHPAKSDTQTAALTSENVNAHAENGGNNEEDDDDDNSSDVSELSDLSHECWQPAQGPIAWVQEQMRKGQSPRKILESLVPKGTLIPEGLDTVMLWKIIINIVSEPPKRKKLEDINTLDDVLHLFKTCKKIIVLTGAGVSVSCGIPDFRSRDGVYARLAKDFPNLPDPQAMFDIHFFKSDPRPFFKFAKEIYPGQFKPSLCHHFIRLLETKGKLLRNYTQNIDTLEQEAGIDRVIQCHGSFATATCAVCGLRVNSSAIKEDIFKQVIPQCPTCPPTNEQAVMKPDIVFFGESLPEHFHNQMAADKEECDLLIVIGSSLKVRPVALIPNSLPSHVPQILINRERLHYLNFDVELLGDCDNIVAELCRRLGDTWDHLTDRGPPLDQVLLSNLPTPPASPGREKDAAAATADDGKDGEGQVSSSSSTPTTSRVGALTHNSPGPSTSSAAHREHSHHQHHHHYKGTEKLLLPPPGDVNAVAEEGVSSSGCSTSQADDEHASEDVDRLVVAGHKKDVVYEPGKHGTSPAHSSSHHHHHHHHSASSSSTSSNHHSHLSPRRSVSSESAQSGLPSDQPGSTHKTSAVLANSQDHTPAPHLPLSSPSKPNRKRSEISLSNSDPAQTSSSPVSGSLDPDGETEAKRQKLEDDGANSIQSGLLRPESGDVQVTKFAVSGNHGDVDDSAEGVASTSFDCAAASEAERAEDDIGNGEHSLEREGNNNSEDRFADMEDIEREWNFRHKVSIAERLANNQMLFIPPSRYVFKGAEVFSDDSDSEEDEEAEDGDEAGQGAPCCGGGCALEGSKVESTECAVSADTPEQEATSSEHSLRNGEASEAPQVGSSQVTVSAQGLTSAAAQPGLTSAAAKPGLTSAAAQPGLMSAAAQPGLTSAAAQPGLNSDGTSSSGCATVFLGTKGNVAAGPPVYNPTSVVAPQEKADCVVTSSEDMSQV